MTSSGMKDDMILHNPRCSKSRATLTLLQQRGVKVNVVEYLKTPPPGRELLALCRLLGVQPTAIVRTKEPTFRELGLSLKDKSSEKEWCEVLHDHPELLERPIVRIGGRAVIGRPPENVLTLLEPAKGP